MDCIRRYLNNVNFYISKLDMDAYIKCRSRSRKRKTIGIHPDPVVTMTITEYRSFTFISVKISPVLAYIQTMQRRVPTATVPTYSFASY